MRTFSFFILVLIFFSCSTDKLTEKVQKHTAPQRPELSLDSKIFLGNRLFSEKTCITCHSVTRKKIGPSVVHIIKDYNKDKSAIIAFLKGKSKPIVDTTSSQVAIMQANIDGFLKKITDEELDAIATYMVHVTEKK